MQYNSETNGQDLISQITFYCDATTTDYSVNDRTRNVNNWYHKAAMIIQSADGTWSWDDANNTTHPIGTTDLVSGQTDYSLDDAMLEIELLELKDSNGNWFAPKPIDLKEFSLNGTSISNYKTTSGTPDEYDKRGRSIFLYPATNYNSTGGMKIHFKRSANIFTPSDTTKTPGFAAAFHDYLSLGASLDYCQLYKTDRVPLLLRKIEDMEEKMKAFYSRRSKDIPSRLSARRINSR